MHRLYLNPYHLQIHRLLSLYKIKLRNYSGKSGPNYKNQFYLGNFLDNRRLSWLLCNDYWIRKRYSFLNEFLSNSQMVDKEINWLSDQFPF